MASTTYSWTNSAGGSFNTGSLWSPSGNPTATGDVALVNSTTITNAYSIVVGIGGVKGLDQLSISDSHATVSFVNGGTLGIQNAGTSGLTMTAGTVAIIASGKAASLLNVNTAAVSGSAVIKLAGTGAGISALNVATKLDVSGSSQISITSAFGELNIGATNAIGTGGKFFLHGGTVSVSNGTVSALTFQGDGGTLAQSGGKISITNLATFSGSGSNTLSNIAIFSAGTIGVGAAVSLNGGTLIATTGAISNTNIITMGGGTLDGTTGGIANTGTITGKGVIKGAISGAGSIVASGGLLEITTAQSNASLIYNIASVAGSILHFDAAGSGGTVTFASATLGVLELHSASTFTDAISNLGIASVGNSVSGDNFINLHGISVQDVKVHGVTTGVLNKFNASATVIDLFSDTAGNTQIGSVTLAAAPTTSTFADWVSDGAGGTNIFLSSVVCYAAGTAILTDQGERAVESLQAGDQIVTLRNGVVVPMPIKWMGERHTTVAASPHPHLVAPIRIKAGAFGEDLPRRDLLVSPAHAIFIDGLLVPANLLINHMTITQDLHVQAVTYYHVELDRHAVIFAEGLTSESYLDTGNRALFANAGLAMMLHPEFHVNAGLKTWESDACAPLAIDADTIAPIWHRLHARANMLGYTPPSVTTTREADVYLEANGIRLRPIAVERGRHTFMLPAGITNPTLRSRATAPADLQPLSGDWRPLGVAVRGVTLRDGDDHFVIAADHPGLTQGWHDAEQDHDSVWRWTAGAAVIPMAPTVGPVLLDIDISAMGTYILARSDSPMRMAA